MHWLAVLLILTQLAFPHIPTILAQNTPVITNQEVEVVFGDHVTFQAHIDTPVGVQEMLVFITPEGQPTVWETMQVTEQGDAAQQVDVRRLALFPFSNVSYQYKGTLADGTSFSSETYRFFYEDNRFMWQNLENEIFQVRWYGSDAALGQEILNIAQKGLDRAKSLLDADLPAPLRIYAYTSAADLQTALSMSSQPWIAGHATPELNMILISVPSGPEKKLELERQIPHEIMHILQYQVIGKTYTQQPVWLLEGMASLAELYPNPEYQRVLDTTAQSDDLLAMNELCTAFPRDANGAFVAYAQSESFVRFLHQKYGTPGLRQLIERYQHGLACDEGVTAALGTSIGTLEYRWKQEYLGINAGWLVLRNLSPYLIIGLLILMPAVLLAFLPPRGRKSGNVNRKTP